MKLFTIFSAVVAAAAAAPANISTIYQFPNGTWLENLALTHNSSILVSLIGKPEVHIVHPSTTNATSNLVASFPNANSVLGITETACDVFTIAVGTLNPDNTPIQGSFSIWRIDLSHGTVETEKLVDLTTVSLVNGIAYLAPNTLFLADSWAGNIVSLDIRTKNYSVAFEDASLMPDFDSAIKPSLGVNGMRVHKGYLYYTNFVKGLLGRIQLASRRYEITKVSGPDDLAVLGDGSVVLGRPLVDRVDVIGMDGGVKEEVVVEGVTSVVVGREWGVVFGCTSGLVGGVPREGGKVVRIDL